MPKTYPPEFKRGVMTVARGSELSVVEVAIDVGVAKDSVLRWMRQAVVGEGIKDGLATAEKSGIVQLRHDKRHLEMKAEILRRVAPHFSVGSLPR